MRRWIAAADEWLMQPFVGPYLARYHVALTLLLIGMQLGVLWAVL